MQFITSQHNRCLAIKSRTLIRLFYFIDLLRLNRPIGIFLLLWPTLWALWVANQGIPHLKMLFLFIMGVILMRSAGCVINDIADRDFDLHVERTQLRSLAAKKISLLEAYGVFFLLISLSFLIVWQFNALTIKLACVGLGFTIIYPFMKRITHLPQLFLGVVFTWGIPMAFAATQNQLPKITWILFIATLCWVVAYDTMYAMVDRNDDLKIGVKSTAILFGDYDRMMIGIMQLIFLLLIYLCSWILNLSSTFFLFYSVAVLLCIYQQILIIKHVPKQCFKAFLNNHWIGLLIFLGIALSYK